MHFAQEPYYKSHLTHHRIVHFSPHSNSQLLPVRVRGRVIYIWNPVDVKGVVLTVRGGTRANGAVGGGTVDAEWRGMINAWQRWKWLPPDLIWNTLPVPLNLTEPVTYSLVLSDTLRYRLKVGRVATCSYLYKPTCNFWHLNTANANCNIDLSAGEFTLCITWYVSIFLTKKFFYV